MSSQSQKMQMIHKIEPYFYQNMMKFLNKNIVVQTTRNTLQGKLTAVLPDYFVIEVDRTPFYVRIKEVIWFSRAISE